VKKFTSSHSIRSILVSATLATIGLFTATPKAHAEVVNRNNNDQVWAMSLSNGLRIAANPIAGGNVQVATANNVIGNQNLKMISRGDGYNFQINGINLSLSASTNLPNTNGVIPLVTAVTNVNNNNQFFYFDNLDATNTKFLLRLKSNNNFCVNAPVATINAPLNLVLCNGNSAGQVWRQQYIGGNPAYVQPMPNGATGVLESAAGNRVSMKNAFNGGGLNSSFVPNFEIDQSFKFNWNGRGYTIYWENATFGISSTGLDYVGLNNAPMTMHAYSNTGGRYGSFGFVDIGGGYHQIKSFFYPKYCLSTGVTNVTYMALCNTNDPHQKIKYIPKATAQAERFYNYEVWLVARKRPNIIPIDNYNPAPGHAFIGLVARSNITGAWKPIKTYSFWPTSNLTTNNSADFSNLQNLLQGQPISDRGHAVRKSRISNSRASWIMSGAYNLAGCSSYIAVGGGALGNSTNCNCADYSTRLWHVLTSQQEDFRISAFPQSLNSNTLAVVNGIAYDYWPDALADAMNQRTQSSRTQFLDNGNRWN
jgi:hypothetical protein